MKSSSAKKQKGTNCVPNPNLRVSRFQPKVGDVLHKKPMVKDLPKAKDV